MSHQQLSRTGRLVTLACLAISLASTSVFASPRIASLDWTLAETLIALEAPPVALAQVTDYTSWVGENVPTEVTDIGLRSQPNMELLAELAPEAIVLTPMFANLVPKLQAIAPVVTYEFYRPDKPLWPQLESMTRRLGEQSGQREQAEALIRNSEADIEALKGRLNASQQPLLVVQFMDARHVRIFGNGSLYDAVMQRLGLTNAWPEKPNAWGFNLVGIEQLAKFHDARLVIVEPRPAGVEEELERSGLWHQLGSVQRGDTLILPPVWSFGGLPSARRFAHVLVDAMTATTETAHDDA
ncbi:iron-siderophore ABC transporter substrate-binding protein [Halomonas binhaiensis]|uniref:Iron-siderophore ABC transporter substrate-binding protein n=1 Tax=Halomonas binhaiensis TaxID=2562282 RepID=A0A5C1NQQ4_9GAMM|nr:iron-siderophore ABC transporter substrate-binding protein [Halomonas binhaiensis]